MTRKEEILKAAKELVSGYFNKNEVEYSKCYFSGYCDGAEWADKNPNPQAIAEFLYKEKGYPITLNGEIPTFEEVMKDAQIYNAYMKKQWDEKVCEWLTLNIGMLLKVSDVEYNTNETEVKDFIEMFKQAMEE